MEDILYLQCLTKLYKMELELIKVKIKEGLEIKRRNYATIVINGTEAGYIDDSGVYLRLYNPTTPFGVLVSVEIAGKDSSFADKCRVVEKHAHAIYDRYDLLIKKILPQI